MARVQSTTGVPEPVAAASTAVRSQPMLARVSAFVSRLLEDEDEQQPERQPDQPSIAVEQQLEEEPAAGEERRRREDEYVRRVEEYWRRHCEAGLQEMATRRVEQWRSFVEYRDECRDRLARYLERIVLWEDARDSIIHILAFNVIYWGIILFQLRGMMAVGSAAFIMFFSTNVVMEERDEQAVEAFNAKAEQFEKLIRKLLRDLHLSCKDLDRKYPAVFCFGLSVFIVAFVALVPFADPILFFYMLFMSIFFVPPILLWSFGEQLSNTEQDGEISEFLPEVTEDNLQVLNRAGETGNHSPTPSNSNSANVDNLDDEELEGLNMPSHEEGSTDGLELSDIELGPGDTDTDGGLPVKRRRFDHDASSDSSDDDCVDYSVAGDSRAKHLDIEDNDSSDDSDFEIIDNHELEELKNI